MQIAINNKNVLTMPNEASTTGNNNAIAKHDAQRNIVDMDIPIPRCLLGKISAISTQVTGPNEMA
jgi:hypothetical protein